MHSRHRSHGNGYRLNSMRMGNVAIASRVSPEGPTRGHVMYNFDRRTYNRGFRRGRANPFQPPQPPTSRGDILVEAGRLAAEYLVDKGLLPQNVLSGRWQNSNFENQAGGFQGFRLQNGENSQLSPEGRNVGLDSGSGRRRFTDDSNSTRNYMRERRRMGSFQSHSPNRDREVGSSRSSSDKVSPYAESDSEQYSVYQQEQQVSNDIGKGTHKPHLNELGTENGGSDSAVDKNQFIDDIGSKTSSSSTGIDLPQEADVELTKRSKDLNDEMEKEHAMDDVPSSNCAVEADRVSKKGNDLLSLCRFAQVPTRTRSSLTIKGLKADRVPITAISEVLHEDVSVDVPLCDAQLNQTQSPKVRDFETGKSLIVISAEKAGEPGCGYAIEQIKCTRSKSFCEASFINGQESTETAHGFGRSRSMVLERGEKRAILHTDGKEGTKKPREEVTMAVNHERSVDMTMSQKVDAEPVIDCAEEKQLFPGSFKIIDLNLMVGSEANENHDTDPMSIFPSVTESKKEAAPVDVDLSISYNCNVSDKDGKQEANGKEVEVIDLDNDYGQEDDAFDHSGRKPGAEFTSLENFPNHQNNTTDIPDIQGILGDDESIYMSLGEIPISFATVWERPAQEYEKHF